MNDCKNMFLNKLHELFDDKRQTSVRLITAVLVAFAFSFTFFVFGPYELFIQSQQYLTFDFNDMYVPMALVGIVVFAVLFVIFVFIKGKVFNYAVTSLSAVTVAGYIQGNFLNIDHGTLDGSPVEWTAFSAKMLLNLLLWAGIFVIFFIILYFSRKIWTYVLRFAAIVLIGAQVIALIVIIPDAKVNPEVGEGLYVSDADEFKVSDKNNVIVFLLDRWDNKYADEFFKKYPEWKNDNFKDFTYYHNFTGSYSRTMPSVCYLLTGVHCDYDIPFSQYFAKAWSESTFLDDIRSAGYGIRVYSELSYVFGNANNVKDKIDNISSRTVEIDNSKLISGMLKLSAYRYMPEGLKPYYRIYTGDLSDVAKIEGDADEPHVTDDVKFWSNYHENDGIDIADTNGEFIFYHLRGAHDPYSMDENGNKTVSGSYKGQMLGNLKFIFEYMQQLKDYGLYDDTTIILTADHGLTGTLNYLDRERVLTLLIKPAGADNDSMIVSEKQICQDNLRASIISYCGIETEKYGRTIEQIGENEQITRLFRMQSCGSDVDFTHRDVYTVVYEIKGNANDFKNWSVKERIKIKYPFYDVKATRGL